MSQPAPLEVPGPKGLPVIGPLYRMALDPIGLLTEVARDFPQVARLGEHRGRPYFLVSDPGLIQTLMRTRHHRYRRGEISALLRPVVGDGLVTADGERWMKQRTRLQPTFQHRRLAGLTGVIARTIEGELDRWAARAGRTVDVAPELVRMTLGVVLKALFSTEVSEARAAALGNALRGVWSFLYRREWAWVQLPEVLPLPAHRRYREGLRVLHGEVDALIEARLDSGADRDDLLGMLLATRDAETGEPMDRETLHAEVLSVIVGGYETTSSSLAFGLALLADHPEVQEALAAEARAVLGDGLPDFEAVGRLDLARRAFQEAMRLYPPGWINARLAAEEDELGGFRIPRGAVVLVAPCVVHRDPRWWPQPERFDPDRFLPARAEGRPEFAWFPFGGGPRVCLGRHLAMMEGTMILAQLARRLGVRPGGGRPYAVELGLTLRPRHGVKLRIEARRG